MNASVVSIAATVTLAAMITSGLADETESTEPAEIAPRVLTDKVKNGLAETAQRSARGYSFGSPLYSIMDDLPAVPVATANEPLQWATVDVNVAGVGFDAIQFKSPLAAPADFYWACVLPENCTGWNIRSAHPRRQNIISFPYVPAFTLPIREPSLPENSRVHLQYLLGGILLPEQQCFIYFKFADEKPAKLRLAIRLLPALPGVERPKFASVQNRVLDALGYTPSYDVKHPENFRFESTRGSEAFWSELVPNAKE